MSAAGMKSQFESILVKYGHDIFLQRRTQTTGVDIVYNETLEKHTVRYSIANSRSLMGRQQEETEGFLSTSERVYYFKASAKPFDGDRIYEYDERAEGNQTIWTIDTCIPLRGTNGDIVFYTAGATRIRPN